MERISALAVRWIALALWVLAAAMSAPGAARTSTGNPPLAVDTLVHDPDRGELRGEGWLVPANPARQAARVQVDGAGVSALVELDPVRRPDVAQAIGRADALEAGWRFRIALEVPGTPGPLSLRFLDADGAVLAEVASVGVARVAIQHGAQRHWIVAWAMLLLLATGLVLRYVRLRRPAAPATGRLDGEGGSSNALIPAAIVLACAVVVGAIAPPFQSPDEFDHVERAYFLSKGQWLLTTSSRQVSGGWVDDGLVDYMGHFESLPFKAEQRIDRERLLASQEVAWQGTHRFAEAPGTGYYLPLVYLPQAVALALGERAGASVDASYRFARLASGVVAALLLFAAFRRWRPSAFAMALLLMPMTVFQWAGAGIDALSIGASCLAMSLWLESERSGTAPSARRIAGVAVLVVAVVGCRIHLAPLLLLPVLMLRPFRPYRIALGLLPALVVGVWVMIALASTQHPHLAELSTVDKLLIYARDPASMLERLWATVTTPNLTAFYGRSFVGVLGWLDTALPAATYAAWGMLLGSAFAWSVAVADWRRGLIAPAVALVMAAASALMVPLMLLLMWTPIDAPVIDGIQGRYFLLPALVLAMAIPTGRDDPARSIDSGVVVLFSFATALYTLLVMLPVLVARYYG